MNKFFLFFTLLFCSLSLLQAQDQLRYGLKAGANLSGYHTENSAKTDRIGYQFGGVINYQSNSYGLSEVYSERDRYKNSVVSLALGYLF